MKVNSLKINEKLKTRIEELDGVKYLVAPVTMVKAMVLNGQYLPADEIAKSAVGWNGRPVVVYHPTTKDGKDTMANDPETIPRYEIGQLFKVFYEEETTMLKAEAWIDIEKAKTKNKDTKEALDMIQNNAELEVSTGYFVRNEVVMDGEFEGEPYTAVQRDIMPDHLALLPRETGACSYKDGAGIRNNVVRSLFNKQKNSKGEKGLFKKKNTAKGSTAKNSSAELKKNAFKGVELKINEDESVLVEELISMPIAEVEDVIATVTDVAELENLSAVLSSAEEALSIVESVSGSEELAAVAVEVKEDVHAVLEVVDAAIEDDGNTDDSTANTDDEGGDDDNTDEGGNARTNSRAKAKTGKRAVKNAKAQKQEVSLNEYIDGIPDMAAREFIKRGISDMKENRKKLLNELAQNKDCTFTQKELEAMETNHLENIHAMLNKMSTDSRKDTQARNTSYGSRGVQNNNQGGFGNDYIQHTANIFERKEKK